MIVKYYECHVTIEPVFDSRLDALHRLSSEHGFKPAKLLMQKRASSTPERSDKDTFCTAHSKSFDDISDRMRRFVHLLKSAGYQVYRNKIEAVVLDERFERVV
jgi:hypothetical protein